MDIVTINNENIDREHICCVMTDKKGENCVDSKKTWLKQRFDDGLVFKKLDVRGKVFIEYIPAEKAWYPVEADGYMMINCFWVSGQYKGKGFGSKLLEQCILDSKSKGKNGIVVISSKKKVPFLSDGNYLKNKGFKVCDTAKPYFELLYLPFDKEIEVPRFKQGCKERLIDEKGIVLFYSNQCPYTSKYVSIIEGIAKERGLKFTINKVETTKQAKQAPIPTTTYSIFIDGKFVTNEILSENKFIKLLNEKGL